MNATTFHDLTVRAVETQGDGGVALRLAVPPALRASFSFEPGQYLTLRADVEGRDQRRCYSIASTPRALARDGELVVGVRAVPNGRFSGWIHRNVKAGQALRVLPPQGRFTIRRPRALHRVGFAAGSGITPILSILTHTLEEDPSAKFTLVYGNRRMASVMFNEDLQDLKDRYAGRLTLIHVLSRQAQEVGLLEGRIDGEKVRAIVAALLPAASMDEVFICGPEAMTAAVRSALAELGVPERRLHTELFAPAEDAPALEASKGHSTLASGPSETKPATFSLRVVLDGKSHEIVAPQGQAILDAAIEAGLDLPYSCKAGVCCTCRARVQSGKVQMARNFGLEAAEVERGFVLTCQASACTPAVVVSFDER